MLNRRLLGAALVMIAVLASACSDGNSAPEATSTLSPTEDATAPPEATNTPNSSTPSSTATVSPTTTVGVTSTADPTSAPASSEAPPQVRLERALGTQRFQRPVELAVYPGGRFVLADQGGLVTLLTPGDPEEAAGEATLLDLRGRVLTDGTEEGFLSVALDPEFEANGYLYAYYSMANPRRTVLSRFEVEGDVADPATELIILEVEQPYANHNGGAIRFGPDGLLYLGLGDGGSGGDPLGNGQNPGTLLGSIIRIDVRGATAEQPYTVPADNPGQSIEGARPEVYAYGLRNPWRMSFDPATDALWAGDVGQNNIEEVDVIQPGGNYGWNILEGSVCYEPAANCSGAGTILPLAEYTHDDGCSVTGGVVYRGEAIPGLQGYYLYGDFCSGTLWALDTGGGSQPVLLLNTSLRLSSFAVDEAGEVYLLGFDNVLHRLAPGAE